MHQIPQPGPEWSVLESIARGYRTPADRQRAHELLRAPGLDAEELFHLAARHHLELRLGLIDEAEPIEVLPRHVRGVLRRLLGAHRHELRLLRGEAIRVSHALRSHGIPHAFTKGMAVESALYGGDGGRDMGDADVMIAPAHRNAVKELLPTLGFECGYPDWSSNRIRIDRGVELMYVMKPDHLPHFSRFTGDPVLRCISVDFANSFTWTDSEWDVPVEWCLQHVMEQELHGTGERITVFEPPLQFLFTILHLFREAWFERTILEERDVSLAKFSDVAMMWDAWRERLVEEGFSDLVARFGLQLPVAWVLVHLDRTLGTDAASTLGLKAPQGWLRSARGTGGKELTWHGAMRERLYSRSRWSLFSEVPAAGA